MTLQKCGTESQFIYYRGLMIFTPEHRTNNEEMCINIYDIRLDDKYPACGMNWPPDIKPVTTYLDVRAMYPIMLIR